VIIVGTKSDLRENPEQDDGESQVTPEEGVDLAKQLNCECYLECSALTQRGVRELFEEAVSLVLKQRTTAKKAVKAQRKKSWWQCKAL